MSVRGATHLRSQLRPMLLACGACVITSAAAPPAASAHPAAPSRGRHARVVVANKPSEISAAPNSFVIGNAYPGRSEVVIGKPVRGTGPGHHGTPWYRLAKVGGGFDHCGWLQAGTWTAGHGRRVAAACSTAWTGPSQPGYKSWFTTTFTNGQVSGGAGDGTAVTLDTRDPGCPGPDAYGNVQPWKARHETGHERFTVPLSGSSTTVMWRYVSRSSQYAMVQGPHAAGQPNWYFVPRSCLPRTL